MTEKLLKANPHYMSTIFKVILVCLKLIIS